jgi:hypothetical protein
VPTDDGVGVTDLLEFDAGVFVWGAGLFAAAAAVAAATAGGLVAVDGGTFGAGTLLGTVAPAKLTVLKWQFPQGAEVTMWLFGLPSASLPLWQLAQGPIAWTWSINRKSRHVVVWWQLSHRVVVIGCDCGSPGAVIVSWQPIHCVGMPLKRPFTWHEAHATLACVPVSGNPVKKWLNEVVDTDCAWPGAARSSNAVAWTHNISPDDLNEIITLSRAAALAGLSLKAPHPLKNWNANFDRTPAVLSSITNERWRRTHRGSAERRRPVYDYGLKATCSTREGPSGRSDAVRAIPAEAAMRAKACWWHHAKSMLILVHFVAPVPSG